MTNIEIDTMWNDPKFALGKLDPKLFRSYMADLDSDSDEDGVVEHVNLCWKIAYGMVRYAISANPKDSAAALDISYDAQLITSDGQYISLETIGIDRADCIGSTATVAGRFHMVAKTALALYKFLSSNNHFPQILPKA